MNLPTNVKPIPGFLNKIYTKGLTSFLTQRIYLNEQILNDLKGDKPSHHSISILIHEREHLRRKGLKNSINYVLFRRHRLSEELRAYKKQFAYLKSKGEKYDLENVAKKLSGPLYLFATNYKNAKKLLENLWNEA